MMLATLHDRIHPLFPAYAQKDLKTAVRVLASALQCSDPRYCGDELFNLPLPTLYHRLDTYLQEQGKSNHTIRNIKNNVSRMFRLAEAHHLLNIVPATPTRRFKPMEMPNRPGSECIKVPKIGLPFSQWPVILQTEFAAYEKWATAAIVHGRDASRRKRQTTFKNYRGFCESYFGFLINICHIEEPHFDQLFDLDLLHRFVEWHVNEIHQRSNYFIIQFLHFVTSVIRQYRTDFLDVYPAIVKLKKTLPIPPETYNKNDAWVPLATIEQIALALYPKKEPWQLRRGAGTALHAGLSLMLRLWTFIPYRKRNMCEMELDDNLYQTSEGTWRIRFVGDQLKVAAKRGRTNVFDLPFPPTLVPVLEDYLARWRPILSAKTNHRYPHVFLNNRGRPHTDEIRETLRNIIYSYTGKHWHPHVIRSVWTTEWIRNTHGDFYTAAIMLNDRIETIIKNYAHLLEEDIAEKAYRLIEERNGQGK